MNPAHVMNVFRRVAPLFAAALLSLSAQVTSPTASITPSPIPNPAGPGAAGGSLHATPGGTLWLTWTEPTANGHALRFATRAKGTDAWTPARTIAEGPGWFINWADFPALTADDEGAGTAVWFVKNPANTAGVGDHGHGPGYHARISRTNDGGRTWSPPEPLTREGSSVEFVSLATLADGRVLAVWLDGRGKHGAAGRQRLYARILGTAEPDTLVDPSVCDCCQTALTAFPDGSAVIAYRGRTDAEVRDLRFARFTGSKWETPRALADDGWRINACPVNGPQLASQGGQMGAVWFTAADGDPRVLASFSADAGGRFVAPLRLNETKPSGRVATALLRNGSLLATWTDLEGAIWLRRVSPDFAPGEPVRLTPAGSARAKGFPRIALARDYAGGKTAAELVVVFAADGEPSLRTLQVKIPEGELLEEERNCECAPPAEELSGFAVRGVTEGPGSSAGTLRLRLAALPGVVGEGTIEVRAEGELATKAREAGREFLGRIDRTGRVWRLIAFKPVATPKR